MSRKQLDINCDMGEGVADEALLFPYISSANIACGGHTGDRYSMEKTVDLALTAGVSIGAHPSFEDREQFGRREWRIAKEQLVSSIRRQINTLAEIVQKAGSRLSHVKPHGALYNLSAKDAETSAVIAEAVAGYDASLALYGLAGSVSLLAASSHGLRSIAEAFADRRYEANGSLRSRQLPGALLEAPEEWLNQVDGFLIGRLQLPDGCQLEIVADSLCIHSDSPGAAEIAKTIYQHLNHRHIVVAPPF